LHVVLWKRENARRAALSRNWMAAMILVGIPAEGERTGIGAAKELDGLP
jgi:hypothetical protein